MLYRGRGVSAVSRGRVGSGRVGSGWGRAGRTVDAAAGSAQTKAGCGRGGRLLLFFQMENGKWNRNKK